MKIYESLLWLFHAILSIIFWGIKKGYDVWDCLEEKRKKKKKMA